METEVIEGGLDTIMRCRPVILVEVMGNYAKAAIEKTDMDREKMQFMSRMDKLGYEMRPAFWRDYLAIPRERNA